MEKTIKIYLNSSLISFSFVSNGTFLTTILVDTCSFPFALLRETLGPLKPKTNIHERLFATDTLIFI